MNHDTYLPFFFHIILVSYKKINNAQGGQSRGNAGLVNTVDFPAATGSRPIENGGHVQSTLHGGSFSCEKCQFPFSSMMLIYFALLSFLPWKIWFLISAITTTISILVCFMPKTRVS